MVAEAADWVGGEELNADAVIREHVFLDFTEAVPGSQEPQYSGEFLLLDAGLFANFRDVHSGRLFLQNVGDLERHGDVDAARLENLQRNAFNDGGNSKVARGRTPIVF